MKTLKFTSYIAVILLSLQPIYAKEQTTPELNAAINLGKAFNKVAKKVIPSVVIITNYKRVRPKSYKVDPFFSHLLGLPQKQEVQNIEKIIPVGRGSGVIMRNNGYILTNNHVISQADFLEVKMNNGKVYSNLKDPNQVRIIGVDKDSDLAVIQIGNNKLKDLPSITFANSANVEIGEWAIAVGAPFNLDFSISVGVVSQKGRTGMNMNKYENYIQTDASINPGNSGGPLLNIYGNVIGINDFILSNGSKGSIGIGFSISSNLAKKVANDLIKYGTVQRAYIGVTMKELTTQLKEKYNINYGVIIHSAVKGLPAANSGIQKNDIVVKIGDKQIKNSSNLLASIGQFSPGDNIPFTIIHKGVTKKLNIKSIKRPSKEELARLQSIELFRKIGFELLETERGLKVTHVIENTPASKSKINKGDIIKAVCPGPRTHLPVNTFSQFINTLARLNRNSIVLYMSKAGDKYKYYVPLSFE